MLEISWWAAALWLLWGVFARPAAAQGGNGIVSPAPDEAVAGVVIVEGTARDAAFLRYELAFRREAGGDWIVFAEGGQPVEAGTLAIWDTTVGRQANAPVFPDGTYQLRLRVVRVDYNYDEYFVRGVQVVNEGEVATPTATPGGALGPSPPRVTSAPEGTPAPIAPALLPSLTPFPTPTSASSPNVAAVSSARPASSGAPSGLLAQLTGIDFGRFGRAFWLGVQISGALFASMAVYIGVRWLLRLAWRRLSSWWRSRRVPGADKRTRRA